MIDAHAPVLIGEDEPDNELDDLEAVIRDYISG